MNAANHHAELEELMASLDGELATADAVRVRAHVAACPECQRMAAELPAVSDRLARWTVSDAPSSLVSRKPRRMTRLTGSRWLPLAAGVVVVAGAAIVWLAPVRDAQPVAVSIAPAHEAQLIVPAESIAKAGRPSMAGEAVAQADKAGMSAVLLVRTARLTLVPKDFDAARAGMERIVVASGGFTGHIAVSDPRGAARSLSATLRIPSAKLDETLVALKALGQVTSESQDSGDVTQQSVDLDARLSNARASEVRLKDILEKRTGRLSDVLDVEREITRVRGDIERMEAERTSLDRRITYAEVSIQITEERKAAVDLGPLSVSARLRNALVDGWTSAVTSVLDLTLVVVRVAPVLTLWALVLAFPAWMITRRFRHP